jgi:hypothetical protein
VIPEVSNFKEEGLVNLKDEKEKNKFWKFVGPCRELNPGYYRTLVQCTPIMDGLTDCHFVKSFIFFQVHIKNSVPFVTRKKEG